MQGEDRWTMDGRMLQQQTEDLSVSGYFQCEDNTIRQDTGRERRVEKKMDESKMMDEGELEAAA